MKTNDLGNNYRSVVERIRAAEKNSRRKSGSVELVAVGKLHAAEAIRQLAEYGQKAFAENFVQEAKSKQQQLSDVDIEWHFIGSIQSNKTRDIANHFSWVHSVDRFKIARRLSDQRAEILSPLNICLQVNLQGEESKSGVSRAQLLPMLEQMRDLPRITVRGLMIVPKPVFDPSQQREVFGQLREILEEVNRSGHSLDTLSMGMTADLEQAIGEGATHVRIGTALFGLRPKKV